MAGGIVALTLALAVTGPANAQLSTAGGAISYSADNLEYVDGEKRLVLSGNVDLLQNDARMQASKLTLFFKPGADTQGGTAMGSGDIQKIVAEGDVHYVRPKQKARGDLATYVAATDTVTFSGNVIISSDDNVLRGETMVIEVGSGRTTLKPKTAGDRIRGVIRPKSTTTSRP